LDTNFKFKAIFVKLMTIYRRPTWADLEKSLNLSDARKFNDAMKLSVILSFFLYLSHILGLSTCRIMDKLAVLKLTIFCFKLDFDSKKWLLLYGMD